MNDDSTTHDYRAFVRSKLQLESLGGFTPSFMPDFLFDFQRFLVEWAVQKGRTAVLNMKAAVEGERREAPKQKAIKRAWMRRSAVRPASEARMISN